MWSEMLDDGVRENNVERRCLVTAKISRVPGNALHVLLRHSLGLPIQEGDRNVVQAIKPHHAPELVLASDVENANRPRN
jgi:hypothetical protein